MRFDFSEYASFQQEITDWVTSRWPEGFGPAFRSRVDAGYTETVRSTQRALGDKGWLCGHWPKEYGGSNWSKLQQAIFNEQIAYRRVPFSGLAVTTVGPTLIIFGTDEQKEQYIPGTAHGDILWSQGFSEPNAGSDLASLQTKAVADGDDFVINGAKIWGDHRHADYALLLARTDPDAPKHKGITQFILPLQGKTPGITIQPIKDATNTERWTLMTLEDVRLPRKNVIGEVNRGWYQSTTTLDFERSQVSWVGNSRRTLEGLVAYAKRKTRGGQGLIDDPFIRDRLGEFAVQLDMARLFSFRVAYMQDQGVIPNVEASMSKLWSTETLQRLQRFGVDLVGAAGLLSYGTDVEGIDTFFDTEFWAAPGNTLAGGASEIQRNIIATRGLGLPR